MRKTSLITTAFAIAALALPAAASAQETIPPGNSGADEYTEGVPGPGGEQAGGGGGDGSEPSQTLPPSTSDDLSSLGSDGASAANLAQSTAPDSEALRDRLAKSNGEGNEAGSAPAAPQPSADDGSVLGDALNSVTATGEDEGLGIWLPILLVSALLIVVATALVRRGRDGTEAT